MANVKTVGPGRDYSTLALWENYAGSQASADQWAECYGDADLGGVTIDGWASSPSSSLYPRIYVADGEDHDGTTAATGAYVVATGGIAITVNESYARVENLRLTVNSTGATTRAVYVTTVASGDSTIGVIVDGCMAVCTQAAGQTISAFGSEPKYDTTGTTEAVFRNCLVYGDGSANRLIGYQSGAGAYNAGRTAESTATFQNCSVSNIGSHANSRGYRHWSQEYYGTAIIDVTVTNLIATGASGSASCFAHDDSSGGGGSPAITTDFSHCLSSDDTADDWGGAGHQINKAGSTVFVNPVSDQSLLPVDDPQTQGWAVEAGENLYGTFTTDAVGADRRPSTTFDLGALTTYADTLGYRIYRGLGGPGNVDFSTPVGTAYTAQTSKMLSGLGHLPNSRYAYVLRPVRLDQSDSWLETPDISCVVELVTDADGQWIGARPQPPMIVGATVASAGKLILQWRYRTPYGGSVVADFGIYYANSPDVLTAEPAETEDYVGDGGYARALNLTQDRDWYLAVTARTDAGVASAPTDVIGPYHIPAAGPQTPVVIVEQTF